MLRVCRKSEIDPFRMGNCYEDVDTAMCLWISHYKKYKTNISSWFSGNSEAFASELPENREEAFVRH